MAPPKRPRLAAPPSDPDELDDSWADGPSAPAPAADIGGLGDDSWADRLPPRPARGCAVPASWADPLGLRGGAAAPRGAGAALPKAETAREPLGRLEGAQRDGRPAWMTKGVGIGTKILGEPTGELIKPGLTRADLERAQAQGPAPGLDVLGEVFRDRKKPSVPPPAPLPSDAAPSASRSAPRAPEPAAAGGSAAAEAAPGAAPVGAAAAAPELARPATGGEGAGSAEEDAPADRRTVVVKNISYEVEEDQFELDMEECGDIKDLRFGAGSAVVEYWEAAGALEALRLDGDEYWGRPLRVELKRDVDARSGAEAFVSGLRPGTSEEAVREFFRGCGEILSARLPKDQDNRSKGVAFITFLSEAALSSALGLSGKLLDGRELTVGKARRMDQPKGAKGSKGGRSKHGGAKGGGKEKGKRDGKGSGKGRGGKGGRSDR